MLCVCLCVNQGFTDHYRYTYRLVILHRDPVVFPHTHLDIFSAQSSRIFPSQFASRSLLTCIEEINNYNNLVTRCEMSRRRPTFPSWVACCRSARLSTPSTSCWISSRWFSVVSTSACWRRQPITSCITTSRSACDKPNVIMCDIALGKITFIIIKSVTLNYLKRRNDRRCALSLR